MSFFWMEMMKGRNALLFFRLAGKPAMHVNALFGRDCGSLPYFVSLFRLIQVACS